MADNNSPIGIFDSGVGGLTILIELKRLLPKETFIYVADQAFAPYGKKTNIQIRNRAVKIGKFLYKKNCKIIIVACNTATIAGVAALRKKISAPVIGVVPVVKKAAEISQKKKVAIFATQATIDSFYLDNLIKEFAHGVTVYKNGATGLENTIEKGEINTRKTSQILEKSLIPLLLQDIDVLALGCTHYPFLKKKIEKIVGKNVTVIDSGSAVARQTKRVLKNENLLSIKKQTDLYYTTKDAKDFERVVRILTGEKIFAEKISI